MIIHLYRGTNRDKKFVRWNGKGTEKKSSEDILEEILTFDRQYTTDKGKLVSKVYYREEYLDRVDAKVKPLILAFPYGRWMAISPPSQNTSSFTKLDALYVKLERGPSEFQNKTLRIFFMDEANSLKLLSNEIEMVGAPIEVKIGRPGKTPYKPK